MREYIDRTSRLPYSPVVYGDEYNRLDTDSEQRALSLLRVGADDYIDEARAWARQGAGIRHALVQRRVAELRQASDE